MDENNTVVETAAEESADEWEDISFIDLEDADAGQPGSDTEQEDAGTPTASDGTEEPGAAEGAEDKAGGDTNFQLTFLGETKTVNRDEIIQLAQKGMNYDHIKQQYDSAIAERDAAKGNADMAAFVTELAAAQGVTPEALMENTRISLRAKKDNISLDEARNRLSMERRENELSKREKALEAKQAAPTEEDAQAKRQKEFVDFFKAHPTVKADDIPKEVYQKMQQGQSLDTAYTAWENAKLKSEIEALRKNAENAGKSVGSASSSGKKSKDADFDAMWFNGE